MVSVKLMLYCMIAGGLYLFVLGYIMELIGKKINIYQGIPEEIRESSGFGWFLMMFITEFLFFVMIPTVGYSLVYLIIPFEGVRPAMAASLFAFVMGAAPIIMALSMKMKLPVLFLVYHLFGYFIKLTGAFIIVGYLYQL